MTFTTRDRARIQEALDLSIYELADGSELHLRMQSVERFDMTHNTAIAARILGYLSEIEKLNETLSDAYRDGSAAAATASIRIDEYSETLGFGSASGRTISSGYEERKQHFVHQIQRDLGYGSNAMGRRIPVM